MAVDRETVRHIARLARLEITEAQSQALVGELNGILGWIEQLQAVDTTGVEPMAGGAPGLPGGGAPAMRMREDAVTDGAIAEPVLANAPDRAGAYFAVPKVVE